VALSDSFVQPLTSMAELEFVSIRFVRLLVILDLYVISLSSLLTRRLIILIHYDRLSIHPWETTFVETLLRILRIGRHLIWPCDHFGENLTSTLLFFAAVKLEIFAHQPMVSLNVKLGYALPLLVTLDSISSMESALVSILLRIVSFSAFASSHVNLYVIERLPVNNCGQIGRICAFTPSGATGICSKSVCTATSCPAGYFVSYGACAKITASQQPRMKRDVTAKTLCPSYVLFSFLRYFFASRP
jgi:hypothetical protein